mmetsp:Transcript_22860/g.44464  ORF Transcript_22860/g.44464 Transcript_22860/m.44464 type:complete len:303 (+) Transcript_22860:48-956(+)
MFRFHILSTARRCHVQLLAKVRSCAALQLGMVGPHRVTKLSWYVLPAFGAIGMSIWQFGRKSTIQNVRDDRENQELSDLAAARGVVKGLASQTGVDAEAFMERARDAFTRAAGGHTVLGPAEMDHAVQELAQTVTTEAADGEVLLQMGPLLFRLLDANHDGVVTLKEFLMGQALLFAAAHAGGAEELSEVCWRALDVDGDGVVSKQELSAAVDLMLRVGAIEPEELQKIRRNTKAKRMATPSIGRRLGYGFTRSEVVQFYMSMYDTDGDGLISRQEFMKCSVLQDNFLKLLNAENAKPIFLA